MWRWLIDTLPQVHLCGSISPDVMKSVQFISQTDRFLTSLFVLGTAIFDGDSDVYKGLRGSVY